MAQFIAPQTRPNSSIQPSWARVHRRSACITTGFSSELFTTSDGIWLRALQARCWRPPGPPMWHAA
ncbi:MAG: hypothetical protein R3A10_01945 [Caldilineaceae bacterium]